MHDRMWIALMLVVAAAMLTQHSAGLRADETTNAEQATNAAESNSVAAVEDEAKFEPPPGYRPKRRGDKVVYCRKTTEIGSRFKVERGYDEQQLRAIKLEQERMNRDFEQDRSLCSNPAVCSST